MAAISGFNLGYKHVSHTDRWVKEEKLIRALVIGFYDGQAVLECKIQENPPILEERSFDALLLEDFEEGDELEITMKRGTNWIEHTFQKPDPVE